MLSDIYLFGGLPQEERTAIERHAVSKKYRRNTIIIEHGDDANALYILVSGLVKVFVADDRGREVVLREQGPGSVLGELALLAEMPRTASVMTLEDSEFLILAKRSFDQCLVDHPNIAFNLVRSLARRIQTLTESVTDFALLDVYGRVAKILTESATEEAGQTITPKFTHQQIADRVGASREMIGKILKDLKIGGYLSSEGKRYILHRRLPAKW